MPFDILFKGCTASDSARRPPGQPPQARPFDHSGHISCAAKVSTIAKRLVILAGQGGVKLSGASISRVLAPPPVYLSNGVIADTLCEPDQSWTRYRVKRIRLQGSTCDGAELCSLCFGMLSCGTIAFFNTTEGVIT